MKINYIAALDPLTHSGGGEAIVQELIKSGEKRGHQFKITSLYPNHNKQFEEADLYFLTDVFNTPQKLRKFSVPFLNEIIQKKPYIHMDNAYVDSCNLDYLPCNGEHGKVCPHKNMLRLKRNIRARDFSNKCFQENQIVKDLYHNSIFNIFLSPLHRSKISNMLGLKEEEGFILKPLIDAERFKNKHQARDIENIFIGAIGEAKGVETLRKNYADKDLKLIGHIVNNKPLGFGDHLGFVPYSEIPDFLNRSKNFVFLPRWPEPQGRVVIEAALCGCNIIDNNNVGATSFDFDISQFENFKNASTEFWEKIESITK